MWGYDFGWGGMLLTTIFLIAVLVVLVWALIRWINGRTTGSVPPYTSVPPSGPSALEILRQRYARGEIDTATYEQMRERLEASSPPGYQRSDSASISWEKRACFGPRQVTLDTLPPMDTVTKHDLPIV
jgi:putative membrane protein